MSDENRDSEVVWVFPLIDLPHQVGDVVRALAQGEHVTVTHQGRPIGKLLPLPPPPLQAPLPHPPALAGLTRLLDQSDLARVLGMTPVTLALRLTDGRWTLATQAKMTTMAALVDELGTVLKPDLLRHWLHKPRTAFRRFSALNALSFPWTPGDATITLVGDLIRQERYRLIARSTRPARTAEKR
jgi:antitoxin (DNA-binding transcriptional repressor) of toxin-antitoxin stability system